MGNRLTLECSKSQVEVNQSAGNAFQKILKNVSWLSFDKIFRIAAGLLVGAWVARYLGPKSLGIMTYAVSFVALFSFVSVLGLQQIVVRELVKRPKERDVILGTALSLRLTGGILSIAFATAGIAIFGPSDQNLILYVAIIALGNVFQAFDIIETYYHSQMLSRNSVIAKNLAFVIVSLFKIFLILSNYTLLYFILMAFLEILLSSIFLMISYRISRHNIRLWKFDADIAKALLKDSWPLLSGMFFVSIYMRIDQIMIGNYLDRSALGIYSVAVYLSQFWYFFPMAISQSVLPYLVSLQKRDTVKYYFQLKRLYALMFWLGVAAGIFFTLFGSQVITILYGNSYIGAYPALVINIWAGIFVAQSLARSIWIVAENLQRYRLLIQMVVAAGNVLGNMYLIPIMGIKGAALTTLFSQCLGTWGLTLFFKPLRASTISMIKAINPTNILRFSKEKTVA